MPYYIDFSAFVFDIDFSDVGSALKDIYELVAPLSFDAREVLGVVMLVGELRGGTLRLGLVPDRSSCCLARKLL